MATPFARLAVAGTGLIGGSFALAARAAVPEIRITGWDRPEVLDRAVARGVVDVGRAQLADAIAGADLIYVALPVGVAIDKLPEIARHASPDALVTDASSTKRAVCVAAANCFGDSALFLGGHPMAGNELSGLDVADAMLFRGATYALVGPASTGAAPTGDLSAADDPGDRLIAGAIERAATSDARVARFLHLITAMGARPMWMDAATHDRTVAIVSHLPQLVAVALAGVVAAKADQKNLPLSMAGRGLRDALRLAGSPYAVWRDIILTNTDNLENALAAMGQAIEHLRATLRQRELEGQFATANEVYRILRELQ